MLQRGTAMFADYFFLMYVKSQQHKKGRVIIAKWSLNPIPMTLLIGAAS